MLILKWFQSGKDVEGKKKKVKSQGKGAWVEIPIQK